MYSIVAAGALLRRCSRARGRSLFGFLGAYQRGDLSSYSVGEVTHWFLYHVSELDLSLGVLPFAALLVLGCVLRALPAAGGSSSPRRLPSLLARPRGCAIFASEQSLRVEERNMFYVAPLFLIALLVWIERGLRRRVCRSAAAASPRRSRRAPVLEPDPDERDLGHDRAAPARMAR